MPKYRLTKDHVATGNVANYDPAGIPYLSLTKQFRKGQIIEGFLSYARGGVPFILFKTSSDVFSNGGVVYTREAELGLELDVLELVVENIDPPTVPIVATGATVPTSGTTGATGTIINSTNSSSISSTTVKKYFTPTNIVIGIVVIGVIIIGLKMAKVF